MQKCTCLGNRGQGTGNRKAALGYWLLALGQSNLKSKALPLILADDGDKKQSYQLLASSPKPTANPCTRISLWAFALRLPQLRTTVSYNRQSIEQRVCQEMCYQSVRFQPRTGKSGTV